MNKLTENEKRGEEIAKRMSKIKKRMKPLMISKEDIVKRFSYQSEEGIEKILKSLMKKADLDFIYKMFPEHKIVEVIDRTPFHFRSREANRPKTFDYFNSTYGYKDGLLHYPILKDPRFGNRLPPSLSIVEEVEKIIEEIETRDNFSPVDLILKQQNSRKKKIYITVCINCNSKLFTHKKDSKGEPIYSLGEIVVSPPHSEDRYEWRYLERIERIGFERIYNLNGVLNEETEFALIPSRTKGYRARSKRHGIWNKYYENGNLFWGKYMVKGLAQGRQQFFYENGNIEKENYLKNGELDGKEVTYYENGTIRSEGYYIITKSTAHLPGHVNLRHDMSFELHESHLKKSKHSVAHGKEKIYYENGQLSIEGEYDTGREVGIWIYYNEDGTIKKKVDGYEVMKKKWEELWG